MNLINLTPHSITLRAADGTDTVIPSTGLARVDSVPGLSEIIPGVPVPVCAPNVMGDVTGLPLPVTDTLFIVSVVVANAVAGMRNDVVYPGTGPKDSAVRDAKGQIVAVTRLIRA